MFILYFVQCSYCTLYNVHIVHCTMFILYIIQCSYCTLYNVHIVHWIQRSYCTLDIQCSYCTLYNVHIVLCTKFILYNVQCSYCALYNVHIVLCKMFILYNVYIVHTIDVLKRYLRAINVKISYYLFAISIVFVMYLLFNRKNE